MENNGIKRSLVITIYKYRDGVIMTGYPKTYNGMNLFVYADTIFPTVTESQLETMNDYTFEIRLEMFYNYIKSVETGLDLNTATFINQSTVSDPFGCHN